MGYHIEIDIQRRTVRVNHMGEVDLSDMESSRAQAVAALTEHGFSRLLIDTRQVTRQPTMTEHHRFASTQPLYMPPHVAIAVVTQYISLDAMPRFEKMSGDRGVQMRAFEEPEAAQAWLVRITS